MAAGIEDIHNGKTAPWTMSSAKSDKYVQNLRKWVMETKPHEHDNVHKLLNREGLVQGRFAERRTHPVFI